MERYCTFRNRCYKTKLKPRYIHTHTHTHTQRLHSNGLWHSLILPMKLWACLVLSVAPLLSWKHGTSSRTTPDRSDSTVCGPALVLETRHFLAYNSRQERLDRLWPRSCLGNTALPRVQLQTGATRPSVAPLLSWKHGTSSRTTPDRSDSTVCGPALVLETRHFLAYNSRQERLDRLWPRSCLGNTALPRVQLQTGATRPSGG